MGEDGRSLLDEWIRRIKNNPILAIVLLVGIGVGAVASFTDSLKSLTDLIRTPAPTIRSFQSRPEEIKAGDVASIEWAVDGADSVVIDNEIGVVAPNGSRQVNPPKTTTYMLTASNQGTKSISSATV